MKFLADENFLGPAVEALREEGFDVVWVLEDLPGATDEEVLNQSVAHGRTLLTFDKDFGYLAFRKGFAADFGIVPFSNADEQSRGSRVDSNSRVALTSGLDRSFHRRELRPYTKTPLPVARGR